MRTLTINLHASGAHSLCATAARAYALQAVAYQPSFTPSVCPSTCPSSLIGMNQGWLKGTR